MTKIVYPGSFDPITNGHLDIIKRLSRQFDQVIVGVAVNSDKNPLFTIDKRVNLINEVTDSLDNVSVESINGLTVDFVKSKNASLIARGVRNINDFNDEKVLANTNKFLENNIETMLIFSSPKFENLSSTSIKQLVNFKVDISSLVPKKVLKELDYNE
ncbi:pantetheine-phosphate adenylyltransferase [Lactobacillus sp. S2-2]|uniref:pantetheine-phosphate adenylyltransferase n=1 Tax=Lactobacillus sp. S2-2 TaxID=2692917 RepID=UPI001EFFFBE5|nr:pantetheine-phosphate adenylyltransferase [Lactobacillus sp. S2-2]MCF6514887.1 pantetheine-phosphate adenylyltransferase [Lactobacillus sp. S2-2]